MQKLALAFALALIVDGTARAQAFRHPGIVVSQEQLAFVKAKIAAGAEPWKTAYARMSGSQSASLSYKAQPRASVDCGAYSSPNNGCSEELADAAAAYAHALMWAYTGQKAHADKAIEILNAWSAVLKAHTNHNAPLQSGWSATICVRAAEIIRHTYDGWAQADVDRYGAMLRTAYVPYLTADIPDYNGNWHLTMTDALMNVAVFLDDRAMFDTAVAHWRVYTPAYVYVSDDGPKPALPPNYSKTLVSYWYGQSTYMDGVAQETCRDLGHTGYGLSSMSTAAETALLQGIDLYGEQAKRMVAGLEFHANFLTGAPVPKTLCGGTLNKAYDPTWEIAYNHFVNRRGMSMPFSKKLIETKLRPTGVDHHMIWETLTHAETGSVGIDVAVLPQACKGRAVPASARLTLGENGKLLLARPGNDGVTRYYGLDGALLLLAPR